MYPIISKKALIFVISLAIILAQISWWVLFNSKGIQHFLRPEIVQSLKEGEEVTVANLPAAVILPILTYLPFWLVVISIIHIFRTLEKRRSRDPLRA